MRAYASINKSEDYLGMLAYSIVYIIFMRLKKNMALGNIRKVGFSHC